MEGNCNVYALIAVNAPIIRMVYKCEQLVFSHYTKYKTDIDNNQKSIKTVAYENDF